MEEFPVILVRRMCRDEEITLLSAMMGCRTAEEALAAYKPEPGDKVEFAWWDMPVPAATSWALLT
jgi:hypothetical protein